MKAASEAKNHRICLDWLTHAVIVCLKSLLKNSLGSRLSATLTRAKQLDKSTLDKQLHNAMSGSLLCHLPRSFSFNSFFF
jgi:hypothetical protein